MAKNMMMSLYDFRSGYMSQPYLEKSVRVRPTFPKWELGS
jgi:hypothetical protein